MNSTNRTRFGSSLRCRTLGLGNLLLLLLPMPLQAATPSSLFVDWNEESDAEGWHQYTKETTPEQRVGWRASGGMEGSGYVISGLGNLQGWPSTGPAYYHPLYTYATAHPVDLVATPSVKLTVNGAVGPINANLKGGTVHLFVGEWRPDDSHAFYYFKQRITAEDDWEDPGNILLTANPADWVQYYSGGPSPPTLAGILPLPQQWGLVIVGASVQPTGVLGFDGLRVAKPFTSESWDLVGSADGWFYYEEGDIGTTIRRAAVGGVGDSGFAWCPLAELNPWPPTGESVLYPLYAYGFGGAGELHPIDLIHTNWLKVYLNPLPPTPSPGGSADLKGGIVGFWIGEWNGDANYTYYRYARERLTLGSGTAGWVLNQIAVSRDPSDWQLIAAAPGMTTPKPVTEIMLDPQQWGLGIFGASSLPLSGNLGFDSLAIGCPEQVTLNLPRGYCWIANNYLKGNNTVAVVLPSPLDGTTLYKWSDGGYGPPNIYDSMFFEGWEDPTMTLKPGEGFVIFSPQAQTIVFDGTQPPHPPPPKPRLPEGWYLVGGRSACPNSFEDFMGFAPAEGDLVILPECAREIPSSPFGQQFEYIDGAWEPLLPLLQAGQAVWVHLAAIPPTAAGLDDFRAVRAGVDRVILGWRTLVEVQTLGFHLERQTPEGEWQRITPGLIAANGFNQQPRTYRFEDWTAMSAAGLKYRLIEIDVTGQERVVAETTVVAHTTLRVVRRDAGIALELQGVPDQTVTLQSTPDLRGEPWTPLETVLLDDLGAATVLRALEDGKPALFYRLAE